MEFRGADLAIAVTFLGYLSVVLALGIIAWRRTNSIGDYILGGRKLGPVVAALSAGASDMSGWLLLGLPGLAFLSGIKAFWLAGGLFLGTWLNWRLVAARLRKRTEELGDALTIPEYFERRFQRCGTALRLVSAFFILFFFTIYTSAGLVAGGKLFSSVFGLAYLPAVLLGACAVVAYTFLGGFLAVSWTDAFQASLMLLALVIVPVMAAFELHSADQFALSTLFGAPPEEPGAGLSFVGIVSLAAWGLGYFGQPHILARFMAISSAERADHARRIATTWAGLGMAAAIAAGMVGAVYFQGNIGDSEKVFIYLVKSLLHPVPAGICLAGILAAIMSTADSQLLVSSSALTEDLYRRVVRQRASEKELVWTGRCTVLLVAVMACYLARDPENRVLDMVGYAWAGFGAGFGPAIILSLFWKRISGFGALLGIVTGGVTVICWKHLHGGLFDLYEIVPGFIVSLVVTGLVSRILPDGK